MDGQDAQTHIDAMHQASQHIRLESSQIRVDVSEMVEHGAMQHHVRAEFIKSLDAICDTLEELSALINRVQEDTK